MSTYRFLLILVSFLLLSGTMTFSADKYHHLPDGTFRNVEGSPERDPNIKWSYWTFYNEKQKIKFEVPKDHVIPENEVLKKLSSMGDEDYVMWIGHATFLMKLGKEIILTDPIFSKNAGPLFLGSYRYVDPAIQLKNVPKTSLILVTHNHYDHLDSETIFNFSYKDTKVLTPLKVSGLFKSNSFKNISELDWYDTYQHNDLKITLLPAIHWSKRTPFDTNESLWGSYLIEYKGKKIFFACDTGFGNVYKDLGKKFGPIDLLFINIGAYDFRPMFNKSVYHTTPEEALEIGRMLNAKKVVGMHWGTFILSLEHPFEPPVRFKKATAKTGYQEKDAILFKIGEIKKLDDILK